MRAAAGFAPRPSLAGRFGRWLAGLDDGQFLRAAFFGMLAATVCVLAVDYLELGARDAATAAATTEPPDLPMLPSADPDAPPGQAGPAVTTDPKLLQQPLTIDLVAGGTLALVGTIVPGAADRLAAEIAQHGEYIKTISLNSPGGALDEALAMGKLVRDRGYSTAVADGALCASSCPLVFAGGKKRTASPKAAIGVHEFYVATPGGIASAADLRGGAVSAAIERTQQTTARISRYLTAMGVDPAMWLHALDTPPQQIYYFSVEELASLKVVTNVNN